MENKILKTSDTAKSIEYVTDSGIRVKISYPENIPEYLKREKINRIYDILSGEKSEQKK
ncbi:MAG: hypothetical protein NC177_16410 [Ruminococcus flavefaciens]|nr:hypothetical protein [Ruminococcus flavefaciens]